MTLFGCSLRSGGVIKNPINFYKKDELAAETHFVVLECARGQILTQLKPRDKIFMA